MCIIGQGESKMLPTCKLPWSGLAFVVRKGTLQDSGKEKSSIASSHCEPTMMVCLEIHATWGNSGMNVMGVNNYFLAGFKAHFTRQYLSLELQRPMAEEVKDHMEMPILFR